jgi:hypothetical protein
MLRELTRWYRPEHGERHRDFAQQRQEPPRASTGPRLQHRFFRVDNYNKKDVIRSALCRNQHVDWFAMMSGHRHPAIAQSAPGDGIHRSADRPRPQFCLASVFSEVAPAVLIGLFLTTSVIISQLMPLGEASVLVHLSDKAPNSALAAAAAADATLVVIPSPGFAVLHGDAARIRAVLGMTIVWKGKAPCSTKL